jgi:SAM-dependent methyltransferase
MYNVDPTIVFGKNPTQYNKARIDYDPEFLLKTLGDAVHEPHKGDVANRRLNIMDVGAGSGKLGGVFLKMGYPVTFVEPNPTSLEHLAAEYANNPLAHIIGSNAEDIKDIEVPDHSIDVVVIGDAAHWMNRQALDQLRRVLTPEGKIIVFARYLSQESPITHKLHKLLWQHCPDYRPSKSHLVREYPDLRRRQGRHIINEESSGLGEFAKPKAYSQDEMIDYLGSLSFCADAVEEDNRAFRKKVIEPLWSYAQKNGLLNEEGKITLLYEITALYGAPRIKPLNLIAGPGGHKVNGGRNGI